MYDRIDRGSPEPATLYFERSFLKGKEIFYRISIVRIPLANQTVLEVGCGSGGTLSYFKEKGCPITGLDPNYKNIQYGHDVHDLNLHCGGIEKIDQILGDRDYFDFVILEQTLEHLSDPISALKMLRKRLKPDGVMYIGVPGFLDICRRYDGDLRRYLEFTHLVHFTLSSITSMLAIAGFELIYGNENIHAVARVSPTISSQHNNECVKLLNYVGDLKLKYYSTRRIIKKLTFIYPIWVLGYVRSLVTGISK